MCGTVHVRGFLAPLQVLIKKDFDSNAYTNLIRELRAVMFQLGQHTNHDAVIYVCHRRVPGTNEIFSR